MYITIHRDQERLSEADVELVMSQKIRSAPRMGRYTAANMKFQSNRWGVLEVTEKERGIVCVPKLRIG